MDPEKNYSTGYTENNLFSRERLDPTPGYSFTSQNQKNKRKSFFIIIGVTFLIIILIVMFLILKNINHASKSPNDLINFVKIYQYGDQNDKKKANLNIPANYTYAYDMALGTASSEKRYNYAIELYNAYLKYDDNKNLIEQLFYYKSLMQLSQQLPNIRKAYIKDGESSANNLISLYLKDYSKISNESIKEKLSHIEEYYRNQVNYLNYANKAGCIKTEGLDNECLDRLGSDAQNHANYLEVATKITDFDITIRSNFQDLLVNIDNLIKGLYKEKIITWISKHEDKK